MTTKKPTYEDLESRIKELENIVLDFKRTNEEPIESNDKSFENQLMAIMSEAEKLANFGSWEWDMVRDKWTMSDNWLKIHGYKNKALTTEELLTIAHPDDINRIQEAFNQCVNHGLPYEIEHRIVRHGTKEVRYIRAHGRVEHDPTGKPVKLYGAAQDITEYKRQEAKLEQSEEQYRTLVERTPDIVTKVDSEGRIVFVNHAAQDVYGISPEECLGRSAFDFIHPEDQDRTIASFNNWLRSPDNVLTYENRIVSIDGQRTHHMTWMIVPERDGHGSIIGFAATARDITDRKLAEHAKEVSEERFRRIFDELSIGMALCDEEGKFLKINQAFTEIIGYSTQEMSQLTFADITLAEFHDEEAKLFKDLSEGIISSYKIEKQCIHKDGSLFWARVHANKLLGPEDSPSLFIGSIENIDQEKRLSMVIKEREEFISLLFNSTSEGIYVVDREAQCTLCNQSAQDFLGYTEKELMGKNFQELMTQDDPQFLDGKACLVRQSILDEKPHHYEKVVMWRADGTSFFADCRVHPMHQEKKVIGAVVTFVDVSEKVKIHEHQLRSSQLAALGELAAGVAHEINNPINGMINYAQLLLNNLNIDQREESILKNIIKEGDRVAEIVKNLLNFARKETKAMELLTLHPLINEPLNLIKTQLKSDGINVEVSIPQNIPPIRANRMHIEQVVLNLLSNSRHALNKKYVQPGENKEIKISAITKETPQGTFVQIDFYDQGCGIHDGILKKIFNPFFTTKEAGVGTGLGLSISQEIISNHGGRLDVESKQDVYTLVTILLPVCDDQLDV